MLQRRRDALIVDALLVLKSMKNTFGCVEIHEKLNGRRKCGNDRKQC